MRDRLNQILFGMLASSYLGDVFSKSDFVLDYSFLISMLMIFPVGPDNIWGRFGGGCITLVILFTLSLIFKKYKLSRLVQHGIYFAYFAAILLFNLSQVEWGAL